MAEQPGAGRLDPETLAAYVDGLLPPEERARVEAEIAADPEDYEWLVGTINAVDDGSIAGAGAPSLESRPAGGADVPAKILPFRRRRAVMAGAGALVAAAAALLLVVQMQPGWWQRWRGPQVDPRLAKLVEAVGEERYVEARLTGGFKYGPLRPVLRGPNDLSQENLQLLAAAGELQKAAEQDPSAQRLHAWGVAQVLVQRTDEGVSFLERAAATGDARTFSDLGVALMSRSTALDRPADLPRALDVLEAALQADPGLVEAWFNKALLLERLGLRQQAIEAWTRYLNLERQDEWRAEGERRVAALRAQSSAWPGLLEQIARREPANDTLQAVAREFPEELRDVVARVYLPEWLLSPDPAAAHALRRRTLAAVEALAPEGGDALFTCALRELDATLRTGRPSPAAVAAVERFRAGLAAVEADRFGEAFQPLVTSVAEVRRMSPALAAWGDFALARVHYFRGDPGQARVVLNGLDAVAAQTGSHALEGRIAWLRGLLNFTGGRWDLARMDFDRATALYTRARERQNAAAVNINLSILARFLGDAQGAWRYRLRALETIPWHDPDHLHGYLITAAITASLHGYQRAALVYQSAAVENAASRGASAQAEAFLQRSRMHFRLGQMDEAAADLRDGEARLGLLADDDMRRRISVSWLTASAEVLRDADSARAVASAQEAIQLTDARRDLLRIAELNLYRGRALSKLGQADEARGALGDGIEAWERAVSSLDRHDPLRVSAIEPVWELFAEAALLALDAGDVEAAFSAVERGRATSILARWQQQPIALADARDRLGPHQAVVIVTQNRTGLAVLTVRATGVEVTRMTMTAAAARAEVGAHLDEIQRAALDGPGTARLAGLMGPVLGKLEDATSVAIVADDPWSSVVWPALRLPTSQLAGERYRFVMAPSVSVALAVRPAPPAGGPLTVVVAPPPAEGFPPLPQASLEAKAVADSYPNSAVLVGAAAGASAVLDLMQRASVVHFAGHAVDVPAYPLMSHLIVSPSAPDPGGRLLARDIARANLAGVDVVVLAACTTAGTRTSRGEGTVGVAWGFIAAGARQVVATRWPVDDAAAARFSIQFHQILSATGDPGMALQAVQRAMSKTESTASWLAPVLVGAL